MVQSGVSRLVGGMFLNKGEKTGMKALPRRRTERQWHWQKLRRKHVAAALWELREDTRASTEASRDMWAIRRQAGLSLALKS